MKRSEMLKKMRDHFQEYFGEKTPGLATSTLKFLEQNGMRPPKGEYIPSGCMCSMREACYCPSGTYEEGWDKE